MCNNLGVCYHKGQCGLGQDDARAAELRRSDELRLTDPWIEGSVCVLLRR
jgi:hypothetical protein